MRKLKAAILILAVVMCASSCDFFRILAGRPTSEDINAKRLLIEKSERTVQAGRDSLEAARKHCADSVALDSTILNSGLIFPMKFRSSALPEKYCVMVGTFSQKSNADAMSRKLSEAGFVPVLVPFRSGSCGVAITSTDSVQEAFAAYVKLSGMDFCPEDVCILSNQGI